MVGRLALVSAKSGQVGNEAAICGFNKCQGNGSPPIQIISNYISHNYNIMVINVAILLLL